MSEPMVKGVMLPKFDGQRDSFQTWWMQFSAFATMNKFSSAVKEEAEEYLPHEEVTEEDETDEEEQARARNRLAMYYLTSAFYTQASQRFLYLGMTQQWPSGLAWMVVRALFRSFRPRDNLSKIEMKVSLNTVTMSKKDSPEVLFAQLSSIQNKYGIQATEDELIATVVMKSPSEYKPIISALQMMRTEMTLTDLESGMLNFWRSTYGLQAEHASTQQLKEIAVAAVVKKVGRHCFLCGDPDHIKPNCPKLQGKKGKSNSSKKCARCGKQGHEEAKCWDDPANATSRPRWYKAKHANTEVVHAGIDYEVLCSAVHKPKPVLDDPNLWIGDTAATVDMTCSPHGMTDLVDSNLLVRGVSGDFAKTQKVGTLNSVLCTKDGTEICKMAIERLYLSPDSPYNVLSITKKMKEGWTLSGDDQNGLSLVKNGICISFDIRVDTPEGVLWCVYLRRPIEEQAIIQMDTSMKMNMSKAHALLGHMSEVLTRKTAENLGWTITRGGMSPCESCALGKGRQKNIPKHSDLPDATLVNPRGYLDCSGLRDSVTNKKSKKTWRMINIHPPGLKITDIYLTKSGMIEPTAEKLSNWHQQGKGLKYLRMDNAGENIMLEKRIKSSDWKLPITIEYTARDTPQQNSRVEVGFATIAGRARALMAAANIPKDKRIIYMSEAIRHATDLDGLIPVEIEDVTKSRYSHFFEKDPSWIRSMHTWGEAGTVTLKNRKFHPKETDRGKTCIFIGHSAEHSYDTCRMADPNTGRVHTTRDIIWLHRMFYPMPTTNAAAEQQQIEQVEADEEEEADEVEEVLNADEDVKEGGEDSGMEEAEDQIRTSSGRLVNLPERFRDESTAITMDEEEVGLVGAVGAQFTNTQELSTMTYKQIEKLPVGREKDQWHKAIKEEHDRMVNNKVFKEVPIQQVPRNSKILSSTWVFKQKPNGDKRARMTARGYEQVNGEHYSETDKSSPVVAELTIKMIFMLIMVAGWYAELVDVRGAFLNGHFEPEHTMYLHVPKGFEQYYPTNVVLLLLKAIYGTKQAAIQFWKLLCIVFSEMGYARSAADPCMYYKKTALGLVIFLSWVDDMLICGRKEAVLQAKKEFMSKLDCEEQGPLIEYVGCKVYINREQTYIRLTQPVMIQSFTDEFDLPEASPVTPAPAGDMLQPGDTDRLSNDEQRMYRSGTGKLLHMMRWSRNDILNRVRELSRFMNEATTTHLKAMYRVMNYVKTTQELGNVICPTGQWREDDAEDELVIRGRSDSEYATDAASRQSVSGTTVFINNAVVCARSRMQKCVTLSVTEAEFVAGAETVQDMLFALQILESLQLSVQKPMILEMDNKGAVDLINNWAATGRTRHICTRINFLRELKEQGLIEVKWISNVEMSSDIFTKNVGGENFRKHMKTYVR
jgi:hypothetical protein